MQFGRFRLGMRTMKSALAVFLCILIFHLFDRGIPMIVSSICCFFLAPRFDDDLFFWALAYYWQSTRWRIRNFLFFCKKLLPQ